MSAGSGTLAGRPSRGGIPESRDLATGPAPPDTRRRHPTAAPPKLKHGRLCFEHSVERRPSERTRRLHDGAPARCTSAQSADRSSHTGERQPSLCRRPRYADRCGCQVPAPSDLSRPRTLGRRRRRESGRRIAQDRERIHSHKWLFAGGPPGDSVERQSGPPRRKRPNPPLGGQLSALPPDALRSIPTSSLGGVGVSMPPPRDLMVGDDRGHGRGFRVPGEGQHAHGDDDQAGRDLRPHDHRQRS